MSACKLVHAVFFVLVLASAVAQASASGVPHVAKTLDGKKTRQLGESLMKDPSSMLAEFEEMVHSGEAPAFDLVSMIKSTIQDEIMQCLQTTRDVAANETADRLAAIELCNNESKARADQIEGSLQVSVNIARSLHAVCRDAQKTMYRHNLTSTESYCVKLGKFLHETKPLSIAGSRTRAEAVDYVKSASLNANMCDRSEVCELDDNCTQQEEELRIKDAECSQKQEDFEVIFCTWKRELELNCEELDRCHSTAVTAYQHHVNKTEMLLEKWNVETAALQKILCYCNVWLSDMDERDNRSQHNATQFDVCKDQTYAPDPVDHGTPAEKAACPLTLVECYPGLECFDQEYSSFADFVATVLSCNGPLPDPPTPTTTPSPCSRDWALGERGTVNGCPLGYSVIYEQTMCQQAATSLELGSAARLGTNSISSTYPGCHAINGHVLFNTHPNPTGTEHSEHGEQVCMCDPDSTTAPTEAESTAAPTQAESTTAPTEAESTAAPTETSTAEPDVGPTCSGDWALGEEGKVHGCPPGYVGIFESTICEQAALALGKTAGRMIPQAISTLYPGCYFNHDDAYFNTHPNPDGSEHAEHAGQICMCEAR